MPLNTTTPHRVLVTRAIAPSAIGFLRSHAEVDYNDTDTVWSREELSRRVVGCDGVLCSAVCPMDADILRHAPTLRAISNVAVGYDNFDRAYMQEKGIVGANTPDVLTETTADFGWCLLMAAARRTVEADAWLREGEWSGWAFDQFLGNDLYGSTLGVVGLGRIGRSLVRRARGFDMRVLVNTAGPGADGAGVTAVSMDRLLRESDHVVLTVPLSPQTRHLIAEPQLRAMQPHATLVNISRGGIVDDAALARALESGWIAAAGLDVFEGEPKVHPGLLRSRRVVLTPHIASASRTTRTRMAMMAAENLINALDNRPTHRVV